MAVTSYAVRTRSPVTSRAAVVYAHKNETIDVITSKQLISPNFMEAVLILHGDKIIAITPLLTCGRNNGSPWSVQADAKFKIMNFI